MLQMRFIPLLLPTTRGQLCHPWQYSWQLSVWHNCLQIVIWWRDLCNYEIMTSLTGKSETTWSSLVAWRPSRPMGKWSFPVASTSTLTSRCPIVVLQQWMTLPRVRRLLSLGGQPWSVRAAGKELQTVHHSRGGGKGTGARGIRGHYASFGQLFKTARQKTNGGSSGGGMNEKKSTSSVYFLYLSYLTINNSW